jgi:hypothetical protein
MAATDPITPEPRRLSIRLPRPLWIAVAAGVLLVTGTGLRIGVSIYRQQAAIREIERRGGIIGRHEAGPGWLRRVVGDDLMSAFDEIDEISFHANSETVKRRVSRLHITSMTTVVRDGPSIDDSTLACIGGIPSVKQLSLRLCDVGDAGMQVVGRLQKLEELDLNGTDVSDNGLTRLTTLKNLKCIILFGTNVTDAGSAALQRALPGLKIER